MGDAGGMMDRDKLIMDRFFGRGEGMVEDADGDDNDVVDEVCVILAADAIVAAVVFSIVRLFVRQRLLNEVAVKVLQVMSERVTRRLGCILVD